MGGTAIQLEPQHLDRSSSSGTRGLSEMLALAVVYAVAFRLGLAMATIDGVASPVWPATGVGLAGLYLLGVKRWPVLLVAASALTLVSTFVSPAVALAIGAGNTLEAVVGVLLLRRLGFSRALERTQDMVVLTVAAAVCSLVSAGVGGLSLVLSGAQPWAQLGMSVWVWWLGDFMGALVVAPALLLFTWPQPEQRWREALLLGVLTVAVGLASFFQSEGPLVQALTFLLYPLSVWAALRFGPRGAAFSWLLIAGLSISGTALGKGPFVSTDSVRTMDLLELQLFLAVVVLTGGLLAAARSERTRTSAQLELLATAVRSVGEGVVLSEVRPGEGLRMVYANGSFCEMVGWRLEELVGRSPSELCGAEPEAEVRQRLKEAQRTGELFRGELVLARKDGTLVHSEMQLSPVRDADGRVTHFVATHRDITQQKQLQAKLMAAERIAAVGVLAAGVGHEIHNPLSYLMLNLDGAARELARGGSGIPEAQARLESAREGAERLRVIVRDLKVFSQEGGEERAMLDVNTVVVPALRMASHAVGSRARLVQEFGQPPKVLGNEARLGQVMLNLLVNALQAIPEGNPERHEVRVRTGRDALGRALVEVSDTGCGMAPGVLGRIFDPFFTTKSSGEGTGLGLSICQQIVQAHGGSLRVRSEEGKGSVFTVLLPAAGERPDEAAGPEALQAEEETPARRRILIIDDEARLAQSMRMLIEPAHEVVVTTRGSEALALVSEGQRFDLVLCDLQMPGMTGMEVYSQLCASAPELAQRLVFISGGAYTQATRDFVRSVRNRILEKPVRPAELLATIDEALATVPA